VRPSLYDLSRLRARIWTLREELNASQRGTSHEASIIAELEVLLDDMLTKVEARIYV
jgi:hypothetical protein